MLHAPNRSSIFYVCFQNSKFMSQLNTWEWLVTNNELQDICPIMWSFWILLQTLMFMLFKRSTVRAQSFIISRIHCWARKKSIDILLACIHVGIVQISSCNVTIFNSVQCFFHFSLRACIDNSRGQITASSFCSASERLSAGLRLLCRLVASHCVKKLISY